MLSKVVVGTDFSKPSEAVLDYLPRLKSAGLQHVILLHVLRVGNVSDFEQMAVKSAQDSLDEQAERLREAGFEVETEVAHGSAAIHLADFAEERGADAIVVGSRGRSLLARIFLGSTSMSLLDQATVPVLIVMVELCRTETGISCELQSQWPFEHILFPTDFSEAADYAFKRMTALVAGTAERVTLFHVHNPPAYPDDQEEEPEALPADEQERLERMADDLRKSGVGNVRTVVTPGSPAVSAVKYAEAEGVTTIAMSTQGRHATEELMVGSVALKVARTSPVPVLMIPHRR